MITHPRTKPMNRRTATKYASTVTIFLTGSIATTGSATGSTEYLYDTEVAVVRDADDHTFIRSSETPWDTTARLIFEDRSGQGVTTLLNDKYKHGKTITDVYGAAGRLHIANLYKNSMGFEVKMGDGATAEEVLLDNGSLIVGTNAYVGKIENTSSSGYSRITNNGEIEEIDTTGTDGYSEVINNVTGRIKSHINATTITNAGTMLGQGSEGIKGTTILNRGTGLITGRQLTGSYITNYGTIVTGNPSTEAGINLSENKELQTGRLENYGEMLLGGAAGIIVDNLYGDVSIVNYGKITSFGGYGTIGATKGEGGTLTIENNGEINAKAGGYAYLSMDDGSAVKIVNNGYIHGDVVKGESEHEHEGGYIEVVNSETGVWESTFTDSLVATRDGQLKNVDNRGILRTLTAWGGEASTLKSAVTENNGTIDISRNRLVIDGDYIGGENARLETSARLGGDDTVVPTLTITGTASGKTTKVKVNNLGGEGGTTVEGITVVAAKSTTGEGFTKDGRIVAGTYDYDLVRYETPEMTEWRLISTAVPGPTPGPTPEPVHKYRPEAAAYGENMRQANTLFLTGSDQRQAVGEYTDPVTGRTETSSLWLSQTGGHSTRHDASGQLKSDYNRYVVQLGGTVLSLSAGKDGHLDAGFQAGYGHASGDNRSGMTGYRARGTVSGYSTGIYGTWRQHREGQPGAYVSTTLQYSWLKNQVKGDDLAAEKYDARGTTLSLEGGYDLAVWQGGEQNSDSLFIRPRAQVTRMGVKADEHREANGTRVSQQGDGNMFSRTGVRVWLDKAVTKTQRVQPFVEANWLHNTRDFCSSMDGVRDCQVGNRDQAEVLAGVTGDVSRNVAVTAQAGGQFGSQASRDLAGTLNVSVKF
ncbi:autotransporter outer membrane beta-barrel domain-containing protein [Salmonella enterica subsp. diarizonae serovar 48:i:z]|nr:autotransporter outer membrane beta-barrel domain-containing protein [Salmonella enterica subsp. diarizonae serovar 48:i:z]EDN5750698.1 autotransporter outer membrane beta-barrel domain-containing protein [Salmonella enterica subsp. diarizonae serovar 48:i:z]